MKNLLSHHIKSWTNLYFCCPISTSLFVSINIGLCSPPFFILFLCPFHCFPEVFSSHTGHVLQVCVWIPFSLRNPRNHKSCQSQLVVLPPPKWIQNPNTRITSGVVSYVLASFSQISVLGTVAFPG
uniref:Uncharacterized protein n=1 Tax=Rousettus aegyptiacus TaxID=9407 RepID=A0A7J8DYA9_ROUAE|nr:hypothetical protein HJG63_008356 [Rousettus aegyptiacus]